MYAPVGGSSMLQDPGWLAGTPEQPPFVSGVTCQGVVLSSKVPPARKQITLEACLWYPLPLYVPVEDEREVDGRLRSLPLRGISANIRGKGGPCYDSSYRRKPVSRRI